MTAVYSILVTAFEVLLVFVMSATLFDVLHFLLHRWQRSRFRILRTFSAWHQVHHEFLDTDVKVHPELARANLLYHLIPEYLTSLAGTALGFFVFSPVAVALVLLIHTVMFLVRLKDEGVDVNHMSLDRLRGRRGLWFISPSYHALHHVHPLSFYSSIFNVFDVVIGAANQIRGRRFAVTGASGAFGMEMVRQLRKLGAHVTEVGRDLKVDFDQTDVLVLAHGAKGEAEACWSANYRMPIELGNAFIEAGMKRLVPPEIWGIGSETEIYGWDDYAASKQQFAEYVSQNWARNDAVTYRHVVPAAFRSKMGWGLMSAKTAVSATLFFARRGFTYIPVTYTGLAVVNWARFRFHALNGSGRRAASQ